MKTMDGTRSAYLPVGGTGKGAAEGEALFDFSDNQCQTNGLKSLGVFIEQNNNEEKTDVGGFDAPIFWSDKDGTLLDDISPWGEWSDSKPSVDSSDSTVYTLTVLNSSEQWTKSNEKPKKADNLDLESFLNILPEAESDSSNYFYPEYTAFVDPKDLPSSPSTNNNDWKANNNNNNVNESLLRSALQGKSGFQRYGSSCKKQVRGCASQYPDTSISQYPVENGNTAHIDEILGFTASDNYGEDFEKIKKIAIEVADCAKYSMPVCNDMYSLSPSDPMIPPSIHPGTSPSNKCFGKKFSKKPMSHSGAKTSSGSARKERSLHYCSICAKGFKDKYSVNVHVRTHTGEKPFTCNLCGKSFRQKAHLAKHYQTHLAQSQKQLGNGNASASRQRPKVSQMDGQHR